MSERLNIQLWSYNYDPEPTGIGPVSKVWAEGLRDLGHRLEVVAAHPHYPEARWGKSLRPYRETRNGIPVLRLPLWIGRDTSFERYRQELSFMTTQALAAPFLAKPDVLVAVSPSFPALVPAIAATRARRIPWVLWLHDILPDGAAASGLVDESSPVIKASRKLESAAYASANRIVVLSSAFTANLAAKGVPPEKIELIYDPATRVPRTPAASKAGACQTTEQRVLSMGNIGFSQGLAELIAAFERFRELNSGVRVVITGNGMAAQDVRAEIRTDRVEMLGVVDDDRLELELQAATIALVTQKHDGSEFNIPSKIMNFMAYGLPVLAAVNPAGEVARIVEASGAGWVVDSSLPDDLPREVARILADPDEIARRAAASLAYAEARFTKRGFAAQFAATLREVVTAAS